MHSNWRDCDAWRKENLPMSTTSNEACKLYDVSLSQLTGYYENSDFNGFAASLQTMIDSDPSFILGHCLKIGAQVLGSDRNLNNKSFVEANLVLKNNPSELPITRREKMHVRAVQLLQQGALTEACDFYEQILLENPTDMMAIKFSQSCYFYRGESLQMRDSIARVMPFWKESTPLSNYLHGMYAFGLVETNRVDEGIQVAYKGLKLNSCDAWSAHAIAHGNEYRGRFTEGIDFMLRTESQWSKCDMLAPHNYWHMALFNIELNDHEAAMKLLDDKLLNSNSPLDLVNSSSLLTRLCLDECKAKDYLSSKWLNLKDIYKDRLEEHGYMYYDFHMALVLSKCGSEEEKLKYFKSLENFLNSNDNMEDATDNQDNYGILRKKKHKNIVENTLLGINREIANEVLNSVFYFNQGEFEKAVDLLYPIRYHYFKMGGSNAQRDIIDQILVHAALRSGLPEYKRIGNTLLNQRLALVPTSDLSKRIASRLLIS